MNDPVVPSTRAEAKYQYIKPVPIDFAADVRNIVSLAPAFLAYEATSGRLHARDGSLPLPVVYARVREDAYGKQVVACVA